MKRNIIDLATVKQKILQLKGRTVKMEVNRGRNKIVKFDGVISNVYPSVFTVEADTPNILGNKTFSYFDVLCGDVKILDN
ncbi:MAG: Veg family protein [Clostridia bacterium]|nr:Veg family protein [Clostridia bacterium]MBR2433428.1 Veg family protein [Clostridia bacterium]MBR3790417.1 Veg family protein [Clostridia bacterium]